MLSPLRTLLAPPFSPPRLVKTLRPSPAFQNILLLKLARTLLSQKFQDFFAGEAIPLHYLSMYFSSFGYNCLARQTCVFKPHGVSSGQYIKINQNRPQIHLSIITFSWEALRLLSVRLKLLLGREAHIFHFYHHPRTNFHTFITLLPWWLGGHRSLPPSVTFLGGPRPHFGALDFSAYQHHCLLGLFSTMLMM